LALRTVANGPCAPEALPAWRKEPEHLETQRCGREEFYDRYWIQALKVMAAYAYEVPRPAARDPAKA